MNHLSLKETKLFPVSEQNGKESHAGNITPQNISVPLRDDNQKASKQALNWYEIIS